MRGPYECAVEDSFQYWLEAIVGMRDVNNWIPQNLKTSNSAGDGIQVNKLLQTVQIVAVVVKRSFSVNSTPKCLKLRRVLLHSRTARLTAVEVQNLGISEF